MKRTNRGFSGAVNVVGDVNVVGFQFFIFHFPDGT